jgi:hypothetical protein
MKEVTDDEHVHNDSSKELPELVENIIKSDSMTTTIIDKLSAYGGAYEGNEIFRNLGDNGVALLYQSKKKNAKVRWKKGGNFFRNLSVLAQKNDLQKWKEDSRVSYDGQRCGLYKLDLLYKENIWRYLFY